LSGAFFPAESPIKNIMVSPIVIPSPPASPNKKGLRPPMERVVSAIKYDGAVNVEAPPIIPRRNKMLYPFVAPSLATIA